MFSAMRLFKAPGTVDGAALLAVFDRVAFERNGENCTAVAPAIAPRVFGNRVESTTGGGYRRRGPGSIATARSAWSYRASGKEGTGDGLDNVAGGDEDDCEEDDESPDGEGDRDTRITADEVTPTEEVVFDYATTSPTSINRQSIVLPHEIPLPASPGVTPTEIA